jgi:hypothetical protein
MGSSNSKDSEPKTCPECPKTKECPESKECPVSTEPKECPACPENTNIPYINQEVVDFLMLNYLFRLRIDKEEGTNQLDSWRSRYPSIYAIYDKSKNFNFRDGNVGKFMDPDSNPIFQYNFYKNAFSRWFEDFDKRKQNISVIDLKQQKERLMNNREYLFFKGRIRNPEMSDKELQQKIDEYLNKNSKTETNAIEEKFMIPSNLNKIKTFVHVILIGFFIYLILKH